MNKNTLKTADILEAIGPNLKRYNNLSWLEQFAMYIGKAQLLEMGLKNLLANKFAVESDSMEKWTMGRILSELKKRGCRDDFLEFLKIVVDDRNHIAHEYLANNALVCSILKVESAHLTQKALINPVVHLEQTIFLFDWTNEYGEWKSKNSK